MSTSIRRYQYAVMAGLLASCMPLSTHADVIINAFCRPGIRNLLCKSLDLVNLATGIVAALALLVFFWGLVKYLAVADDDKSKTRGKNIMGGGIVVIFVMFSIFGIVRFFQNSFDINASNNSAPDIPEVIYTI